MRGNKGLDVRATFTLSFPLCVASLFLFVVMFAATATPTLSAISQVGTPQTASQDFGASIVVTIPSGYSSGTLLLAFITQYYGASYTTVGPSGWTEGGQATLPGSGLLESWWWKLANGSEGTTQTWTSSQPSLFQGAIIAYNGVHQTTPIDQSNIATNQGTTTRATISSTLATAGDRLVFWAATTQYPVTFSTPGGFTGRWDNDDTVNGQTNEGWDEALSTNSAPGTVSSTISENIFYSAAALIALEPDPNATPTPTSTSTPVGCTTIPGTSTPVGAACLPQSNYPALGTYYDPYNYGADPTGNTDSTTAVQRALSLGNVYFGTPGTYSINGGSGRYITVSTTGTVIECAPGVTLKSPLNNGSVTAIFLIYGSNISLAGCDFQGVGPNTGNTNNGNTLVWVYNSNNALIEGNTFENTIADAALQFSYDTDTGTPGSVAQYNTFTDDRVLGLVVEGGTHITFNNNLFIRSSIGVEGVVGQPMGNITLTNNQLTGGTNTSSGGGYALSAGANVQGLGTAAWPYYGTNSASNNYCAGPNTRIYDDRNSLQTGLSPLPAYTNDTLTSPCFCDSGNGSC